ncbi:MULTISPECIES: SDR family NAD(P)-dependent oxidoreductase [Enterobacteriaceae]|uniref:SDR family oxidoreductase n=1 Tax=Raoultella lignicola TaxID=3040939 RepID=A0ABU9F8S4_9ENTR|nr:MULTISPECIES: SDR family oxidoreductase [Enterobacteriaceae]MRT48150.1 SDR family oxidoreductase [Raoultella sp. RIT712]QNK09530.1 SDR family oxidoreductase [Enterobacter sp. JUb54]ROS15226.1 NAD(P)-dependent dehydrogenase (short-subunit alcohol dehydrogenase family) [Raoultella sp. BIGb0399]
MKTKTVVVTGASSGIGFAIAQAFVQRGDNVVANAPTRQGLEKAAQALGSPDNLLLVAGDISLPETAEALFTQAEARFGRVDVLVNNAGVFISRPIADYTPDDVETMLAVNMKGFFYTSQRAAQHMRAQGGGHIIAITAAIAMQPNVNVPALLPIMVKGGLNHAVKGLALELADAGIMVNAIAPGIISTPMHSQDPQTLEALKTMAPTRLVGDVQDMVNAVMYLTDSRFVTGSVMVVDGGATSGKW